MCTWSCGHICMQWSSRMAAFCGAHVPTCTCGTCSAVGVPSSHYSHSPVPATTCRETMRQTKSWGGSSICQLVLAGVARSSIKTKNLGTTAMPCMVICTACCEQMLKMGDEMYCSHAVYPSMARFSINLHTHLQLILSR